MREQLPIKKSHIIFRKEADNWAVLFDPCTEETYGLDPISILAKA